MCVAHNTVSVRWWRVLWARCFVTWCGPYSTEPSKSRMSGSPDDQSLGREAFSFRPLPLQNRIGGRFVNLASKQKEWRRSWLGNIVLRQSRASCRPECLEILFCQPFLFLGFLKIAALQMALCTREQPMVLHAFPAWRVRRLAACFHLLPFRSAASLWFQGGSNQLLGLHSPFWVWAGVPFHSLWSSSCVDPGVSFLSTQPGATSTDCRPVGVPAWL